MSKLPGAYNKRGVGLAGSRATGLSVECPVMNVTRTSPLLHTPVGLLLP